LRRWIKKSAGTINKPAPLSVKNPDSTAATPLHAAILRQLLGQRVGDGAAFSAGDCRIRPHFEAPAKASGLFDS
jgi:hypothetical protein